MKTQGRKTDVLPEKKTLHGKPYISACTHACGRCDSTISASLHASWFFMGSLHAFVQYFSRFRVRCFINVAMYDIVNFVLVVFSSNKDIYSASLCFAPRVCVSHSLTFSRLSWITCLFITRVTLIICMSYTVRRSLRPCLHAFAYLEHCNLGRISYECKNVLLHSFLKNSRMSLFSRTSATQLKVG